MPRRKRFEANKRDLKPPKWLIPLLAEPVDESWKKLLRRSQYNPQMAALDMETGAVTAVEDTLRVSLGTWVLT